MKFLWDLDWDHITIIDQFGQIRHFSILSHSTHGHSKCSIYLGLLLHSLVKIYSFVHLDVSRVFHWIYLGAYFFIVAVNLLFTIRFLIFTVL